MWIFSSTPWSLRVFSLNYLKHPSIQCLQHELDAARTRIDLINAFLLPCLAREEYYCCSWSFLVSVIDWSYERYQTQHCPYYQDWEAYSVELGMINAYYIFDHLLLMRLPFSCWLTFHCLMWLVCLLQQFSDKTSGYFDLSCCWMSSLHYSDQHTTPIHFESYLQVSYCNFYYSLMNSIATTDSDLLQLWCNYYIEKY